MSDQQESYSGPTTGPHEMSNHPPVPKRLAELLVDYPQHIQQLQIALDRVAARPVTSTPAFELAVWAIEGALEELNVQARKELEMAGKSGDAETLAAADAKLKLMRRAYMKQGWIGDGALSEFFSGAPDRCGTNTSSEKGYVRRGQAQ